MMVDELLNEFINESIELLSTIESDLLTIEENGINIDIELVNKVFRAAHSIKGSSSFFGLNKVKDLAHKAETILDMLRTRKIIPNAEITNILLSAFDTLREMINKPQESDAFDTADLLSNLSNLATSYLPAEKKDSLSSVTKLNSIETNSSISILSIDYERAVHQKQFIYKINLDLIHDAEKRGKSILDIFKDISTLTETIDCYIDFSALGNLDGPVNKNLPLTLIVSTLLSREQLSSMLDISKDNLIVYSNPNAFTTTNENKPFTESIVPPAPVTITKEEVPVTQINVDEPIAVKKDIENKISPKASKLISESNENTQQHLNQISPEETLRVNVELLDTLMNLAGELVLSRNQLHAAISQKNAQLLTNADQRINQVTAELQNAIMQTRLQPIGNVFNKFPRVVRDVSRSLNKEINLEIVGKEVALDRSLIEGLSDPLTHMVRNAVDHGIESSQDRNKTNKSSIGTIKIEARHEAGQVVVEISDDGKGIDPKKIADAAVLKGLITEDKIRGMSDDEKVALIFLPGLSTAQKVTDISGRGVGMDVVKTNLDRLGGKVEVKSVVGKGSVFNIKLPLTLAIIPSLIISVEEEMFAIPQVNIVELIRVSPTETKNKIEIVSGVEVLLLRDKIIPLVRFDQILGVTKTYFNKNTGIREVDRRNRIADRRSPKFSLNEGNFESDTVYEQETNQELRNKNDRRKGLLNSFDIVIVTTGNSQYGLVVGKFHNTEEIVVKPLGRHLKSLREYAGATILGNGTVALIIDIGGLALKADLTSLSGSARAVELSKKTERERIEDIQSYFIFHTSPDEPCAVPLESVLRLEKINQSQVELKGGKRTMQYRGNSLPLVALSDIADVKSVDEAKELAVIVSQVRGHEVGLLGTIPVDVVESKITFDSVTHRQKGIAGSAIIRDKTTLVTDLNEIVENAFPDWFIETVSPKSKLSFSEKQTILLVEDSTFFRTQIKRYLEEDGFTIIEAPDGEAGWEALLQNIDTVNMVITDIEMPRLTGLQLAARIKADKRTAFLRILALSSLAGEEDIARGKEAGIEEYQVKLDRDKLLESVRTMLTFKNNLQQ
jgi:two-component system chemotaxis sensor kinase CheA